MREDIEKRFSAVSRSKTFANILQELGLRKKAVMDVGCSYGEHLAHFGEGSVGITIAPEEMEYGKNRGLAIENGNIEDENFSLDKTFDVIFANNIFEHLLSPHSFLIRVKKFLKPDGVLILGVPCIPKIVSLLRLSKFRGSLASNHINFFTKEALVKTVERGGWEVLEVRSFRLTPSFLDHFLNFIAPHFYVVARPLKNFQYEEKRAKELKGYQEI